MIITGANSHVRSPAVIPLEQNLPSPLSALASLIVPEFVFNGTLIELNNTAAFKFTILSGPLNILGGADECKNNLNMSVSFVRDGVTYTYLLYPALPNDSLFIPLYQGETIEQEFTPQIRPRAGTDTYICDGFQFILLNL